MSWSWYRKSSIAFNCCSGSTFFAFAGETSASCYMTSKPTPAASRTQLVAHSMMSFLY
ncbi:hypothetical protein DPMN_177370 [Dreissena polymorpha]|uniref:Uncharacterized protein n=1 Tax=Dreissena polymorpha TaxID=45954 RepID=A0A9D4EB23_DREPO|nr:hypothetical protein DPMN_177370 [Dreissena polymorpha]